MSDVDLTGENRLVRNVITSFAGHFVFVVLGFVMPRIIDGQIGQASLGVWDFSWSFVSYLGLAMVGIGSSVNRYVAKFRSENDVVALNRLVSSVIGIQIVIAAIVLMSSLGLMAVVPVAFGDKLEGQAIVAGRIVGLLGSALAVQMAFDAWRGVITGCHRWDLYNAINTGGYIVSTISMILVLFFGQGLVEMAIVYLCVTILTEIVRLLVAIRVCPECQPKINLVNSQDVRMVFRFGVKTIVLAMPRIVILQTTSIFVLGALGPAALAVLARPISLFQHISTLVNKYSFVLAPMAGAIDKEKVTEDARDFALRHSRVGWLLSIPPLAFMFVLGDRVIEIWMGPAYANWPITAILACGYLLPVSQSPFLSILIGRNMHGQLAKSVSVVAISLLASGIIGATYLGWSLQLAAFVISISTGLGLGVIVLYQGLKSLGIEFSSYWRLVIMDAVKLLVSVVTVLIVVRHTVSGSVGISLLVGVVAMTVVVLVMQRKELKALLGRPNKGATWERDDDLQ